MLHIVTDSSAHALASDSLVTVVPNRIVINGEMYLEGVNISPDEALRLLTLHPNGARVQPPTAADYVAAYRRQLGKASGILSLHASRALYDNWAQARAAIGQIAGQIKVEMIDSMTFSSGQTMLVEYARRAILAGHPLEEVVRRVRGAVERVYMLFYSETMDFLFRGALSPNTLTAAPSSAGKAPDAASKQDGAEPIMTASHAALGTLLGIKPLLTVEHGRLIPIEKVRTRLQAVERIVEFAIEFEHLQQAVILGHRHGEQTRMLCERLQHEFPDRAFPEAIYDPSLAVLIGVDSTGLVVMESDIDDE
jgi:fatty acid-binding protein DegV